MEDRMEHIAEEFGKGFLALITGSFLFLFIEESMAEGGMIYSLAVQFMQGICGG